MPETQAHDGPFGLDLPQAPEAESSKSHHLLDPADRRLRHPFAACVPFSALVARQLLGHAGLGGILLRIGVRGCLALTGQRYIAVDVPLLQRLQVRFIAIARVQQSRDLRSQPALLLGHPAIAHRLALARVGPNLRPVHRDPAQPRQAHRAPAEPPRRTPPRNHQDAAGETRTASGVAESCPPPASETRCPPPASSPASATKRCPSRTRRPAPSPSSADRTASCAARPPLVRRVERTQIQRVHQVAPWCARVPFRDPLTKILRQQSASGPALGMPDFGGVAGRMVVLLATMPARTWPGM